MKDIKELVAGVHRFQAKYFHGDDALFNQLKSGQQPSTLMIACSDSRVDPALLTSADPGDLFMVRNVANLVPPYEPDTHYHGVSAAIEYAVTALNVKHVVVKGHSSCGGIRGLLAQGEGADIGEFVGPWVHIAESVRQRVVEAAKGEPVDVVAQLLEKEAILHSLDNLLTFPFVKQRVDDGELTLHGWYLDIASGELQHYDPEQNQFKALVQGASIGGCGCNSA